MMNKVVRFKGNTRFVPREAGNLYIDGDRAVLIDQAGNEFVFAKCGSDGQQGGDSGGSGESSGSGGSSIGGATFVEQWPDSPEQNVLYVTANGARMYYGDGQYVELSAGGSGSGGAGGTEYVDQWPQSPVPNRLYVTDDGVRIYHGDSGEYVELTVDGSHNCRPVYPITVIPSSTTNYLICDSMSDENGGSWRYVHEPVNSAIYVLPVVQDATVEHCAIVTVKFTESQSVAFVDQKDFDNHDPHFMPIAIMVVNDVEVSPGAVVEYVCKYDPLQSKWVVTASPMN